MSVSILAQVLGFFFIWRMASGWPADPRGSDVSSPTEVSSAPKGGAVGRTGSKKEGWKLEGIGFLEK